MSDTPPASATSLSPERRLWQARWMATSDDEQAVSIETLGPRRSSKIRQTVGEHAVQRAGQRARVDRVEVAVLQLRVVVVVAGDEDAGPLPRSAVRAASRRRPAPRSRPRGTGAAADPSARPRAAGCRSSRRRTRRSASRNPPHFATVLPRLPGRGRTRRRHPTDRPAPRARHRHRRAAGARTQRECLPPGTRHPMPTIAIGSARRIDPDCARVSLARSASLMADMPASAVFDLVLMDPLAARA